ncbi:MAG: hypothetical protein H6509_00055 [Bryobacterales bacterium]|nr:hypothetical protein [Bryobacterales bacterium]
MDLQRSLGFLSPEARETTRRRLLRYINLQLRAQGLPAAMGERDEEFADLAQGLLASHLQQMRLLANHRCPADQRIEAFLNEHFQDLQLSQPLRLPSPTLILDRHGMARELALPADGDSFTSAHVESYRCHNGVLHNPKADRRTTKGTFHVCAGGLPVPADKLEVPRLTFAKLFEVAVSGAGDLLELPFTSMREERAHTFVSLLLRPLVSPEVPNISPERTFEVRFFAPGNFVSNLDFVESIFGNAGDPYLPENDAGLDIEHWTGHTGCVILAPQLQAVKKVDVGLPHYDEATERQRRDGMCWKDKDELYNGGSAFKITCRTAEGVIVTIISDNYFGYCKKEVKTQISYAANLLGNAEEEHAGGAVAYPSFNLGEEIQLDPRRSRGRTFTDVAVDYPERIEVFPEGYGVDRNYPEIVYIPDHARASLREQCISWKNGGATKSIPLQPNQLYIAPGGFQLRMEKHPAAPSWRLIGTTGWGTVCHKPCTVSGGGKSEISKSLRDYMHYGPVFVSDIGKDLDKVDEVFERDYQDRWKPDAPFAHVYQNRSSRKILSPDRSLGSVIKLLTPSPEYTDGFNAWLETIPDHIYAIVFIIKRFHSPEWGDEWRRFFSVDIVNGHPGHELKFGDRKLVGAYLRVGLIGEQTWRTFKLRQDFAAAAKVQTEDDISASVVIPGEALGMPGSSYKFVQNCEYRLFQRPDDAIHRGLDKQTEWDLSRPANFVSNFEPLTRDQVLDMTQFVVDFDAFSEPMQSMLKAAVEQEAAYVVCSANPRQIDGKPTKNPRYLQDRPDLANPIDRYAAEMRARLAHAIPAGKPLYQPVDAVMFGRRNNPPEPEIGIRGLAVYGPIHYQELPELFMDFIASLTGKSPSTTGFGLEGALTKGPFNALSPAADLNASFVSYALTGLAGFSTAAGYVGPQVNVGHDISLLIPEIWCRLGAEERTPQALIAEGLLEQLKDYERGGSLVRAGRLGWRINAQFVRRFFGRVFDNPEKVFDDSLLRPESQNADAFADGVRYICEAHASVAQQYLDDGTADALVPPLRTLVEIMAKGDSNGVTEKDPAFRAQFTRDAVLGADWYQERLQAKQLRDAALWRRHAAYVANYPERLRVAQRALARVQAPEYLASLQGTLGAHPF